MEIPIHPDFLNENKIQRKNDNQKIERSLSEVLDEKTYKKLLSIIEYLEENDRITPKTAERILGKSAATTRREPVKWYQESNEI